MLSPLVPNSNIIKQVFPLVIGCTVGIKIKYSHNQRNSRYEFIRL